ncbi:MAG TPA: NrfD/PsrC family molybdoenzyme membrane anchor subunit [Thermoanaerobaculia bacterium]|nr:NrfD/PsrC family molybdoenzyme membrane anchor subunit [Thermoanaerobaculia bacterium]
MNFAFVIDNRRCIGCHACSTACKSENSVPLGVHRTWVKYVEKGVFPATRRYFQVTRCNHCASPPCVPICPTAAMFRRPDGIVEFDREACIGCKACLQACPYDAIHIDPESGTAAKCHFCAHRTDVGLEPACVVVCPVHAILAGDLDDPASEVARAVSTERVSVRKPEQGTRPKLFYIEGEDSALFPMLASQTAGYLWGQMPSESAGGYGDWRGPIQISEGRMAGALVRSAAAPRETYNVGHRVPWHWQVPAYLVTKAIGAGMLLIAAIGTALGWLPESPLFVTAAPILALLLTAVTTALLVADLDRPERFWKILARPQWRSWLTRGALVLMAFAAFTALWWLAHAAGRPDLARSLAWPASALAVLAAIYTAFLFAQAEGRDLWQSPLLSTHLLVQSVMAGAAGFLLLGPFFGMEESSARLLAILFAVSLGAELLVTAVGEFGLRHASAVAAAAARMITRGRYAPHYWTSLAAGTALPLLMVVFAHGSPAVLAASAAIALAGLFLYEWAFVFAPQQIPNS